MRKVGLIVLLGSLVACQNYKVDDVVKTPVDGIKSSNIFAKQTVSDNQSEWKAKGISNYSFVWKNTCYCLSEYTQSIKVLVKNGVIAKATYLESGLDVSAEVNESLKTIEQVFSLLDKNVANADKVSIVYDDAWSVPTNIFIDRDVRMADEEIQLTLSEFIEL